MNSLVLMVVPAAQMAVDLVIHLVMYSLRSVVAFISSSNLKIGFALLLHIFIMLVSLVHIISFEK